MNNEKDGVMIRVRLNNSTDKALKKILEAKHMTVQSLLESLINEFVINNLECFLGGK
jgi:predicted DNA-binding ribbon-helix-helix protein